MNKNNEYSRLPQNILKKASLSGNEYAWRVEDIPKVIEAAKELDLLNIGGQLQFRFPKATCECYWVEVDVQKTENISCLSWANKILKASEIAKISFENLQAEYDFLSEGKDAFPKIFEAYEQNGNDPRDVMYFVWYLEAENQTK